MQLSAHTTVSLEIAVERVRGRRRHRRSGAPRPSASSAPHRPSDRLCVARERSVGDIGSERAGCLADVSRRFARTAGRGAERSRRTELSVLPTAATHRAAPIRSWDAQPIGDAPPAGRHSSRTIEGTCLLHGQRTASSARAGPVLALDLDLAPSPVSPVLARRVASPVSRLTMASMIRAIEPALDLHGCAPASGGPARRSRAPRRSSSRSERLSP